MDDFEAVEILLVEDSDADAELIIRALRKGGVVNRVMRLRDGVEALEFVFREGAFNQRRKAASRGWCCSILRCRGWAVSTCCAGSRPTRRTKIIPVVVLTSSAEEQDVVDSYRLGVNSYLVKPVDFTAFTSVITKAGLYWAVMNQTPKA